MSASLAFLRPPMADADQRAEHDSRCDTLLPLALEPSLLDPPGSAAAAVALLAALSAGAMAVLALLVAAMAG